jgi:hypothetical protein
VNAFRAVTPTISLIDSGVLKAPAGSVYFSYINPSQGATAETAYDAVASGVIYGMSSNPQRQIFTSLSSAKNDNGELNMSAISNATIVLAGGPCPQKTVRYYEDAGLAPVRFVANQTHYIFVDQNNVTLAALATDRVCSGHEDMFVIEAFMDKSNLIIVMYGFSWRGTWASAVCFKEVILNDLNHYSQNWYVFHWIDSDSQDGIPQSEEIHSMST